MKWPRLSTLDMMILVAFIAFDLALPPRLVAARVVDWTMADLIGLGIMPMASALALGMICLVRAHPRGQGARWFWVGFEASGGVAFLLFVIYTWFNNFSLCHAIYALVPPVLICGAPAYTIALFALSLPQLAFAAFGGWMMSASEKLRRRYVKGLCVFLSLTAAWFLGVDWCWVEENCEGCGHGQTVISYRICTISVHERHRHYPTTLEWVAADLGVPCQHKSIARFRAQRWLGLCLPVEVMCALRLWDPHWYPPCARNAVRSWAQQDPEFPREFYKRVIEGGDWRFYRYLTYQMYDACPPHELPKHPFEHEKAR